ncbi:MAG: hypothetical protein Q4C67_07945, partial [Deinococcus sp.]|nr:hypothetical protein [Deinococcus sp.]
MPQQLYDEAALLNARIFHVGNDWNAVIAWADSWIERLDVFPDELVEISLGGSRKDSGARVALAQLALKGRLDVRVILRKALQELDAGANPPRIGVDKTESGDEVSTPFRACLTSGELRPRH